jgi:putative ABC transport system permease protein
MLTTIFDRATRAILHCAPRGFRETWGSEILATGLARVTAARPRGASAVLWMAALEWISIARLAIRERLGLAPVTSTPPPRRDRPARRSWIDVLARDVVSAARALTASRLNAAIALVTLVLGIGVSAATFSVLDAVLWRPVPFANADRLVELVNYNAERKFMYAGMSRDLLLEWRAQHDLFERLEAFDNISIVYRDAAGSTMVPGAMVTPGLFPMLGRAVSQGRNFTDADGRGGTDRIAIVSDGFWRERLHRTPDAIGATIDLDNTRYTIAGVMPASFRFPDALTEIWLPYNIDSPPPTGNGPDRRSIAPTLEPFGRLAAGLTRADAKTRIEARGAGVSRKAGVASPISATFFGTDLVEEKTAQTLTVLAGAVAFLLVIVCANLANLSLSRSLARVRDFAVRAAVGASRAALVRQTLVENLLLGLTGAAGGALVAAGFIAIARRVLPDAVRLSGYNAIDLDGRTLLVTAGLGIATSIIFGLPPAWMASRTSAMDVLRHDTRSMTTSRGSRRLRGALVVVEVAISMVLLVGAALMARTLVGLYHADRGLDPAGLVDVKLGLPAAGYTDVAARDAFIRDAVDRVRQLPGVTGAAAGIAPPANGQIAFGTLTVADEAQQDPARVILPVYTAGPGYFETLHLPIVDGRAFTADEAAGSVVVNESFAHRYWPAGHAIGGEFRLEVGPWLHVVGIAADVRRLEPGAPKMQLQIYQPQNGAVTLAVPVLAASTIAEYRTIVVRVDDPVRLTTTLPGAIHAIDPTVVVWKIDAVEHLFADSIARPRVVFAVMTVFAGFGLLLAAAGLYGVLSYLVSQRRREIGIRLALGARPARVGFMVVRSGLLLTAAGLAIGLTAALALVRVMQTLLYNVQPSDPISVIAVVLVVAAAALAACWRPARQAMKVDPLALLRME